MNNMRIVRIILLFLISIADNLHTQEAHNTEANNN
jgi:hypothetical protein